MAVAQSTSDLTDPAPGEWPSFGRTLDMTRYSPLDQIDRDNVGQLELAWARDIGFERSTDVQMGSAVYDGVMYVHGPQHVLALDAATGDFMWEYRPELLLEELPGLPGFFEGRNRGSVVVFDGKVYFNRADGVMVALDTESGEELWANPVTDIDLAEGFTSGPIFADGKILAGPSGSDMGGVPGRILAVDAENGEVLWSFNTIPQPGEANFASWDPPESAEWGGGSAWMPGAYDPVSRTVVYGVGQPTPWNNLNVRGAPGEDFTVSSDLYTASWVGLDVDTGELKWYFQVVPADEWDYDQMNTPIFADLEIDGENRRVAIMSTTTGYVLLLDAATGEFLRAHQMFAEPSIHLGFEADGTPIINDEARYTEAEQVASVCPFRWVNWDVAAFSPDTGLYYRPNTNNCPEFGALELEDDWEPGTPPFRVQFNFGVQYEGFDRIGALSAIDPITGEVVWEYTHPYAQQASPVATGGGLVFSGFPDRVFRAFNDETGEVLWEQGLTAIIKSAAITYMADGKQYVAVIAGAASASGGAADAPPTVPGPAQMFVFALP